MQNAALWRGVFILSPQGGRSIRTGQDLRQRNSAFCCAVDITLICACVKART